MSKKNNAKKERSPEEKYAEAVKYQRRYSHSRRELHKAIIGALPPLKNGNSFNTAVIDLTIKAGKIMDLLAEPSRTWNISVHWLYTVCNPKIEKSSNARYSPIYQKYATILPINRFGELDRLIENDDGSYERMGDKLVGDIRFVGQGCEDFGSSWNDDGEVIKWDNEGHPVLTGFVKEIAQHIDELQKICCRNPKRDRHFEAFLIAHPRDDEPNKRDGTIEHKGAHAHAVIDMPTRRSRYQMMELLGYNFDDLATTFKWIGQMDRQVERIDAFLGILQGAMQNFVVTQNYVSSLQYLVHQSKKAKKDQKTPYAIGEVISWLPDDPGKTYSSIAGVYDDEIVAEGVNAEVIRNLHTPYNEAHHTAELVGRKKGARVFTYAQLGKLRGLGTKGAGNITFSKRSKKMILDQLMSWIYQKEMQVNDWKKAIHGAFNDSDATSLITDRTFINKLDDVLNDQREATINDVDANRNMLTIFISASQGGAGKSFLAKRLCQYYDKGRTPYMTASEDKDKTVDYWQDYEDQKSAIIDEISASSIGWSALKDMLDPHKIPRVASRFHNACPWNVSLLIMTNVYSDGVAGYVRDVLHYAPGVTKLGYLEQDENNKRNWKIMANDSRAGQVYLSQLSQLLRRLPINIHILPSNGGKGTKIIVSTINFRPGGRSIQNYDYVYTEDSVRTFNCLINDELPEEKLNAIILTIAKMIKEVRTKAQAVFENNPNAILDEKNGFIRLHCNLGFYVRNDQALLFADGQDNSDHKPVNVNVSPSVSENMLTRLIYLRYQLAWGASVTNFAPNEEDQVAALLKGKTVPLQRKGKQWLTLTLSQKALKLVQNGQVMPIIERLNKLKSVNTSDDLFTLGRTGLEIRLLPNKIRDEGGNL